MNHEVIQVAELGEYPKEGLVIAVVGQSGSGKTTAVAELFSKENAANNYYYEVLQSRLEPYPTWTTRPLRPGEHSTSYDHRFVSQEEFDKQKAGKGFVLEQGFAGNNYGLPRFENTGRIPIFIGLQAMLPIIEAQYPNLADITVSASSEDRAKRFVSRGDPPETVEQRLIATELVGDQQMRVRDVINHYDFNKYPEEKEMFMGYFLARLGQILDSIKSGHDPLSIKRSIMGSPPSEVRNYVAGINA